MKARLFLGLCALLAFPGCFDPIVGSQCAKGYSRCGNTCVVAGTCDLPDAGDDALDLEAGMGDGRVDPSDTPEAETLGSDASDDSESLTDATNNGAESGALTDASGSAEDAGSPYVDEAGPESTDADVKGTAVEDASTGAPGDAESSDNAVDAPAPLPDSSPDAWFNPDHAFADSSDDGDDDGLACPDCDGGVDAPGVETGGLAVDGVDAGDEDGGIEWGDAEGDAQGDAVGVEAGPLVCEGTLTNCNEQCVDLTSDPENCGSCAKICTSGVCNPEGCLVCAAEESVCGRSCVNLASDPDNCGGCGNPCPSGLCSHNFCEAAGTGRVIVIGHDYINSRPIKNRLLGNAVFLWPVNPVRLLLYAGDATAPSITGADWAIAEVGGTTRQVTKTYGSADSIPDLLPLSDVFLIYAQNGAGDTTLQNLGIAWESALTTFVNRGGTVIVLDADQTGNAGTVQILSSAHLLNLTRQASASTATCNVVARGDALAAGMYRAYSCQPNSTTFTMDESSPTVTSVVEAVVGDAASAPVVVSKIF
jgi:hypothetical protein